MIRLNTVIISGRLTQAPEMREVGQKASKLAKFGIAYNNSFGTPGGRKTETLFIDIQAWDRQANFVEKYLKKGDFCIVDGEVVMEQWRGKMGEFKSKIAIRAKNVQKIYLKSNNDADGENEDGEPQSQIPEKDDSPNKGGHRYSKKDCIDPRNESSGVSYQAHTDEPMYDDAAPF